MQPFLLFPFSVLFFQSFRNKFTPHNTRFDVCAIIICCLDNVCVQDCNKIDSQNIIDAINVNGSA